MTSFAAPRDPFARSRRTRIWVRGILGLIALIVAVGFTTSLWTGWLWYDAVGFAEVFTTTLLTKLGLFLVFGLAMAIAIGLNLALGHRLRPGYRALSAEQQALDRYREAIDPHRRIIAFIAATVVGLFAGSSAAGRWSTFLEWWNRTPVGTKDPQFGLDASFYMFGYPWYRFLLGFGFVTVFLSLLAAAIAHYLYGGIRLQAPGRRASTAAQAHLSVLVGLFILLKAVAYWFDRYGLLLRSHRLAGQTFTGVTYTDAHALLPAKTVLTFIAVICAFLFFANLVQRTWLLPGLGLALLVLSAILMGWLWPLIIQQFQVRPNEPDREAPYIERNIVATRRAYGVQGADVTPYTAKTNTSPQRLASDAETLPGIRVIDPSIMGETFEQLQQVRGFYSFPHVLDVDRYQINGQTQDTVLAPREINLSGLPADQRNWNNDHTVFTHGYGLVAAYGNRKSAEGSPVWLEQNLPPQGQLTNKRYQPRIYFGEESPDYSIVGRPRGESPIELDIPAGQGTAGGARNYTYRGKGGVAIGSFLRRMLYAAKFQDGNILLSGRVNSESRIMYDRSPAERVRKVAPWLTVDSDPYPAVVNHRIVWIVDGYTSSDNYPFSQRTSFEDATSDSLTTTRNALVRAPSHQINYMRNSVKAVVDAYDGTVKLYAWDPGDPVLKTWMKALPGTVRPRSEMSNQLLDHVRYPLDLFEVQREILARYHVRDSRTFYEATDRWKVPSDPNQRQNKQPAYYLSVRMPGRESADFSLTSTYIFVNRENLAAFAAVDSNARSADYGNIRVLALSNQTQIDGPNQIANKIGSNSALADRLRPLQRSDTKIENGNLLTLPVGGGLLYVQPVYVERKQSSGYPLLRLVVASFGGRIGVGDTLDKALTRVFQTEVVAGGGGPGGGGEQPPPAGGGGGGGPSGPGSNPAVRKALAEAEQAFADADAALRKGDLKGYADAVQRAQDAVARALAAEQQAGSGASPTPKPSRSPKPKSQAP